MSFTIVIIIELKRQLCSSLYDNISLISKHICDKSWRPSDSVLSYWSWIKLFWPKIINHSLILTYLAGIQRWTITFIPFHTRVGKGIRDQLKPGLGQSRKILSWDQVSVRAQLKKYPPRFSSSCSNSPIWMIHWIKNFNHGSDLNQPNLLVGSYWT